MRHLSFRATTLNPVIIFFIALVLLTMNGCGKRSEPLSCDSPSVKMALLDNHSSSGPVYYSRKITNIKVVQKSDQSLQCNADLSIQSNLDNRRILVAPVNYTVYRVDKKSQSNTSELKFTDGDKLKVVAWVDSLNALAKQLGDYQLTPGGAIYVMKESDEQTLYFNGQPINPLIKNGLVSIEKAYTLGNKSVFLIGSYTGGTIDADTQNNRLIQIESTGQFKITEAFAVQSGGILQTNESLVINGIIPFRTYAESTDFPIYMYSNGNLTVTHAVKPDSYYQEKFSAMSAESVVNIAKSDQCFDSNSKELDTSHACNYATKYCFMYKALKDPKHDDNYSILEKACESGVLN